MLTVLVTVLDYLIPVVGTRRFGGTKYGIWGCVIGMLAGAIFFPPFGLILGGFFWSHSRGNDRRKGGKFGVQGREWVHFMGFFSRNTCQVMFPAC